MAEKEGAASFYMPFMAYAVHALDPTFKPSQMLAGDALKKYADVTENGCWYHAYASFLDSDHKPLLQKTWADVPAVQKFFKVNELGVQKISGPLFIIGGEADMSVPIQSLKMIAKKMCTNGTALTFRAYPGLDHDPTMDLSTPDQLAWIKDRFEGKPSMNSCSGFTQ
jgi:pimeloyl-ACP methyl ester carboxylesterase